MTSMLVLTLLIPEYDSLVTLGRNCFRATWVHFSSIAKVINDFYRVRIVPLLTEWRRQVRNLSFLIELMKTSQTLTEETSPAGYPLFLISFAIFQRLARNLAFGFLCRLLCG